ncbi:M3 family oligoendopeptidase [cf. Phormidesmis sp. LEGE 11477]|uniref:M3 family oligoendopeptidase n=1 Tax=cf. Phormidesmis sp. LEGE 11477 TaxID=1828680 RepID=UPI00187F5085|nr:M3 family oligoendopeptidase [cf. Phormidesmis sp. LEGE 11477]MBE9059497.1 M3 family oligoendopeptidase [cf. Phormidesmis sp. LEGE 11477]
MQTLNRPTTTYLTTWDNAQFFTSTADPAIASTISQLRQDIDAIAAACQPFTAKVDTAETIQSGDYTTLIDQVRPIHLQRNDVLKRLGNVNTYIYTALSVDTQDADANTWMPILQKLSADLSEGMTPLNVFLQRASEDFITALLADPALSEIDFLLRHSRKEKDFLLSVAEEQLMTALATNGLHTWGNLYSELAGTLKCEIQGEVMGLAKAANMLGHPSANTRQAAWEAIRSAWATQQTTVATGLNAINGWRLESAQKRSGKRQLHYLDKSCHQSRIERATLDALMETTYQNRAIGQRALSAMAKALGQSQLHPWDTMAPAPAAKESSDQKIEFEAAIALIADAFNQLTPEMGDFATMMAKKGWIDGKPTPNRATGAYCTKFSDPREPRIFMTYEGTMTNVLTLAHELGHAWHNWVMRDLPAMKCRYPMTLAETASIFAETLVREALMAQATTPAQKLEIAWQDAQSAGVFLLNIPARFEFEKRLVEARKIGALRPAQLCEMMDQSWQLWFEESLSQYNDLFWASKLHFSISSLGFYNYPYLFGYLFSLGIYAQQPVYGDNFNQLYTDLLRDTGTMTAEAVVKHHLQKDLSQPQFWQDSLSIVEGSVADFEQLVSEVFADD